MISVQDMRTKRRSEDNVGDDGTMFVGDPPLLFFGVIRYNFYQMTKEKER